MYPPEILDADEDDGTMPENVASLESELVGRRIVEAGYREYCRDWDGWGWEPETRKVFAVTLDDGRTVCLRDTSDCCAYTALNEFLLHPEMVDHMILGVGTSDGYHTWHIFADLGDILELSVGWSGGNLGYYGYGFDIDVIEIPDASP